MGQVAVLINDKHEGLVVIEKLMQNIVTLFIAAAAPTSSAIRKHGRNDSPVFVECADSNKRQVNLVLNFLPREKERVAIDVVASYKVSRKVLVCVLVKGRVAHLHDWRSPVARSKIIRRWHNTSTVYVAFGRKILFFCYTSDSTS